MSIYLSAVESFLAESRIVENLHRIVEAVILI